MPTISEFDGITVRIHTETNERHHEPHVHVITQVGEASVSLSGEVLSGEIRSDKLRVLRKWLLLRQIELAVAWMKAVSGEKVSRIDPLKKGE